MPLIPRRDQYATYIDAFKRAEEKGKKIITVVTNGDKRRENERKLMERMEGKGAFNILSSGVFGRAANDYRTIFDKKLNWAYKIGERRGEISLILGKILEHEND
jgi:chromosome partitioning protein